MDVDGVVYLPVNFYRLRALVPVDRHRRLGAIALVDWHVFRCPISSSLQDWLQFSLLFPNLAERGYDWFTSGLISFS